MISIIAASFTSGLAETCIPPRLDVETSSFDMIVEFDWPPSSSTSSVPSPAPSGAPGKRFGSKGMSL